MVAPILEQRLREVFTYYAAFGERRPQHGCAYSGAEAARGVHVLCSIWGAAAAAWLRLFWSRGCERCSRIMQHLGSGGRSMVAPILEQRLREVFTYYAAFG